MNTHAKSLDRLSPEKRALFEKLMLQKRGAAAATGSESTDPSSLSDTENPWQGEAWLRATVDDLGPRLESMGRRLAGPVERIRTSYDACVLKVSVSTPEGASALYYKAVPKALGTEINLARLLAETFPGHLPQVLESGDDWYLMESLPGHPLTESKDPAEWCHALRDFAHLQVASSRWPEKLLAAGCVDRSLPRLAERLERFLGRGDDARFDGIHFFESLARQQGRLERTITRLQDLGLPPCLDHGDFHPQNIHVDAERAYFFDFSDSSLAHPFFAPQAFMTYLEHGFEDMAAHADRMKGAFFEPWLESFEQPTLEEAFRLGRPLATLHHLLNMAQILVDRPRTPAGRGRVLYRLAQLEAFLQTSHVEPERPEDSRRSVGRKASAGAATGDVPASAGGAKVGKLSAEKRARLLSLLEKKRSKKAAPAETPWENAGWFEATSADLEARLSHLGQEKVAPIAFLHSSQDSCVLHVATPGSSLYYKAVPSFFTCEVKLARLLAKDFPRNTPDILDSGHDWYLMASMPGRPLSEAKHLGTWQRALRDFARLQMAYVGRRQDLLETGCQDRDLSRLMERVDRLLSRREAVCYTGLSFFADLEGLKPELERAVARLATFEIPQTLEHGDFHHHNIYADEWAHGEKAREEAPTIFFDFSDGSVSHPFFSPLVLIGFLEFSHPHLLADEDALRDAYLEPWQELFPRRDLLAAFEAAKPLAKLSYLLNVGECLANRPRPAPEESIDMRQAMGHCFEAVQRELSMRPVEVFP